MKGKSGKELKRKTSKEKVYLFIYFPGGESIPTQIKIFFFYLLIKWNLFCRWKKWGTTWEPPGWRHPKSTSRILPTRPAAVHSISTRCRRSWRFDCSINTLCFSMVCKSLLYEHPAVLCSTKSDRIASKSGEILAERAIQEEMLLVAWFLPAYKNLSLFRCSIRI